MSKHFPEPPVFKGENPIEASRDLIVSTDINQVNISLMVDLIDKLVPIHICRRHQIIPIALNDADPAILLIGMIEPGNLYAYQDLDLILRHQNILWQPSGLAKLDYEFLIDQYLKTKTAAQELLEYQKTVEQEKQKERELQKSVEIQSDLEGLEPLEPILEEGDTDLDKAIWDAAHAPIINLVNKILAKALHEGVSDIHVQPQEHELRVRFRKDGILYEGFKPLPKQVIASVTARFKVIANMDIAERRAPQDGRIRRKYQGRNIDFRVSSLATRYGEKIVLRILDNSQLQLGLEQLISESTALQTVREMINRSFGLLLITGPTGSGKSTTLYSALAERNQPGVNICTVEDPIEYTLPGITQVQVDRAKGINFTTVLRSFLRQDPDIILVGETRDSETAKTAAEAALTGHLVLTTLHTNDAPGAISRLTEMGVESFLISSFLIGVVAQRLVRRVCPSCRQPYSPSENELNYFSLKRDGTTFYKANPDTECEKCHGVGYKGRSGVYEIMPVNKRLQRLITSKEPTERLKEVACEDGMKTLLEYSLDLVKQGITTLAEVKRVIV